MNMICKHRSGIYTLNCKICDSQERDARTAAEEIVREIQFTGEETAADMINDMNKALYSSILPHGLRGTIDDRSGVYRLHIDIVH